MSGIGKVLRGVMTYRKTLRKDLMKEYQRIADHPEPSSVVFSCVDSRLLPTRITQSRVGDMFIVRNAGNLVMESKYAEYGAITTVPGVLELGCIINDVKDVIVWGHSDCKAMNLLYSIRNQRVLSSDSPLSVWLQKHGEHTVRKYEMLEKLGGAGPLTFQAETADKTFEAYIDPENKFDRPDKFSQINTLQQLQHLASYKFLHEKFKAGDIKLHAIWFDVYTGDIYLFDRQEKTFVEITEETVQKLMKNTGVDLMEGCCDGDHNHK